MESAAIFQQDQDRLSGVKVRLKFLCFLLEPLTRHFASARGFFSHVVNFIHCGENKSQRCPVHPYTVINIPRLSTLETVENWIRRKIGSFKASGKLLLTSRDSSVYISIQHRPATRGGMSSPTSLRKASKKFNPEWPVISQIKRRCL